MHGPVIGILIQYEPIHFENQVKIQEHYCQFQLIIINTLGMSNQLGIAVKYILALSFFFNGYPIFEDRKRQEIQ